MIRSSNSILLLLTSGLLAGILPGCHPSGPAAAHPVGKGSSKNSASGPIARAICSRPMRKDLVRKTEQPGQIEAYEVTPLYARVTGFIKKINVDIGDRVTGPRDSSSPRAAGAEQVDPEGQVLAEISVPELEAEVRQKQALVAQTRSEVKQAAAAVKVAAAAKVSAEAQVIQTQAMLEREEARYKRWKSELARLQQLAASGSVTRKLVDETESEFQAANATRRETEARIKSVEAKAVESDAHFEKAQADAETVAARLNVVIADQERSQAMLSYAKIRAPYDGVVSARNVHTGHLVQVASGNSLPLLVVARTDIVRIFVDVPEADAALLKNGSTTRIRVLSLGDVRLKGTVKRTTWVLSPATRTLRTEIDVDNREGKLRPGMYANAEVMVAERSQVLALPQSAIQKDERDEKYCFGVNQEGQVIRIPVKTGLRAGEEVEILSGLQGDEQIITSNPAAFKEGQRVEATMAKVAK